MHLGSGGSGGVEGAGWHGACWGVLTFTTWVPLALVGAIEPFVVGGSG